MNVLFGLALILVCPFILHASAARNERRWRATHRIDDHSFIDSMPSGSAWGLVVVLVIVGVKLIGV